MRLLADTHIVFWATMERARLSQAARTALESEENDVLVSIASAWEIAIKVGLGKWPEARDLLFDFEHTWTTRVSRSCRSASRMFGLQA